MCFFGSYTMFGNIAFSGFSRMCVHVPISGTYLTDSYTYIAELQLMIGLWTFILASFTIFGSFPKHKFEGSVLW